MDLFKKKKQFPKGSDHVIVEAFKIAGVQYFKFDDPFNMPYDRAMGASKYYNELEQRCTREYMIAESEASTNTIEEIKKCLSGEQGKINIVNALKYLSTLERFILHRKERLNWIIEVDIVMKLASVVFFDDKENPAQYDMKYNIEKKIPFWKKQDVDVFFSTLPIGSLIPYLQDSKLDFRMHSELTAKINAMHINAISEALSPKQRLSGLMTSLTSRAEISAN